MELTTVIPVQRAGHSKLSSVNFKELEFGKYTSDHMLLCDYDNGEWVEPAIVPYSGILLEPSTLALHYGQTVFEGMKAFRMKDARINIFRIKKHYERLVRSLDRMCMAVPPEEIFTEGLIALLQTDGDWVPKGEGQAFYIRPFIYASEARFGIKISDQYRFIIFGGPVPSLYTQPIKVKVETKFVRAAKGGTGFAKCGGNYGAAYYPTKLAREEGYDQVLWTDANENKFIEESGMMNVMFVINNRLVTPPLSGSILDGITRDSLLTIANHLGYEIEERPVSVDELEIAFKDGSITEAFGVGTAAVVAPIGTIQIKGKDFCFEGKEINRVSTRLKNNLEEIRTGLSPDIFGWNTIV